MSELPHVFDATTETFEADVLRKSLDVPVLVDFWATWCGPCKTLGPILEKLAGEYNGAFVLAKVDVDKEQQIAAAFQIRSVPTVFLVKGGQIVDGFPGALPEGQLREFLASHGVMPAEGAPAEEEPAPLDPHAQVAALREAVSAEPDKDELKLDLVLALLKTGEAPEAERLLDALPANLATDDRAVKARARLGFAAALKDAPSLEALRTAVQANPDDLRARHLLGVHALVAGDSESALEHFLEMLKRDRAYEDGLARKSLIDAFRVIEDDALVSQYRRKMSSLLF
ncbi:MULTISPECIES: thioredoxin [unclassified Pseudoxanthomonas]|uniref:thioredoxin n=1 Tax=unclassified Pseudoxanthomonas TaxID=2645906 RepID=UPI0008E467EE|nr:MULTISPECIES: thioredoxin [unclassified Pseudoxanthomonas]PPJ43581.1 thioredoxin [Pseudoxanthomonas sp. KAs_5_3]SFV35759.1 thioredoxin [Pseudoxanthomonas sp. YR558]